MNELTKTQMNEQMNGAIVPMIHLSYFSCKLIVNWLLLSCLSGYTAQRELHSYADFTPGNRSSCFTQFRGASGTFSFLFLRTLVQLKDWLGHWREEIKCISVQKPQTSRLVISGSQWTNSLSQQVKGKGRMIFIKMFHQSITFQMNLMAPCTLEKSHPLQSRVL